jgi:hypothetical protein
MEQEWTVEVCTTAQLLLPCERALQCTDPQRVQLWLAE